MLQNLQRHALNLDCCAKRMALALYPRLPPEICSMIEGFLKEYGELLGKLCVVYYRLERIEERQSYLRDEGIPENSVWMFKEANVECEVKLLQIKKRILSFYRLHSLLPRKKYANKQGLH